MEALSMKMNYSNLFLLSFILKIFSIGAHIRLLEIEARLPATGVEFEWPCGFVFEIIFLLSTLLNSSSNFKE